MWYVYILQCKNRALYTGATNDLGRRLSEHVAGKGGSFTRSFGVKKMLYSEAVPDKSSALKREAQIKKWTRSKKLDLIQTKTKL